MAKHRLAIVTTHPIQYNAPFFRALTQSASIDVKVFYTWSQTQENNKFDPDFGRNIQWDIPLLEGYDHEFVPNNASKPGSDHFLGIKNPTLVQTITQFKPDALLVYGWNFYSHLRLMIYFKGKVPVWFRGDSTLLDDLSKTKLKRFLRKIVLKFVYRFVDIAFYVGSYNRHYYEKFGLFPEQLIYAPHAVDNDRFSMDNAVRNKKAEQWRSQLGIGESEKVILFAGKIEAIKNIEFLLTSFLAYQLSDLHLVLVGEGPLKGKLMAASAHDNRVHWLGFINQAEMPIVYRMSDIVILPSLSETWGLCLNEAMASGRCIAASTSCGASVELVAEGKTGWTFNSQNEQDIVNLFDLWKFTSRSELLSMGQLALKKVQDFNYQQFCKKIENMLIHSDAS